MSFFVIFHHFTNTSNEKPFNSSLLNSYSSTADRGSTSVKHLVHTYKLASRLRTSDHAGRAPVAGYSEVAPPQPLKCTCLRNTTPTTAHQKGFTLFDQSQMRCRWACYHIRLRVPYKERMKIR